ncbi:hypothetical protein BW723_16505 [Polaribacter reichenbachii]|uniref:Uncharacterized protein n=1 Tax=Polaribacter reichenbachii TaxID=996801 RepID=A0A1B8TR85_9FLAO|nr:hypothetical protein [Polaribacter reichenbachii]APZ47798.1 hypothetical protein BW723_16505 [Polaribacter reichenbachii]AUC18433.1 hypothetical protein BTO17_06925 [Polaribacter reichenbachii]OBY62216.1 hypothetical protein LPB301_15140 [Polaribacter reichenbachii]
MVAKDVYNIAKALSKKELYSLYNMLKSDMNTENSKLKTKPKLPDFTMQDGLRYLLENQIKK